MKRVVAGALGTYLLSAAIGKVLERLGAVRCGCAQDCWCRKPVLSNFRWVLPFGHHSLGS